MNTTTNQLKFFTIISSLIESGEMLDLRITKAGEELAVLVTTSIKGKKASPQITGSPEDLDAGFIDEINKPIEKIRGLVSDADTVKITDASEEESEEEKTVPKVAKKADSKKAIAKPEPKKTKVLETPILESEEIDTEEVSEFDAENEIVSIRLAEEKRLELLQEKQEKADSLFTNSMLDGNAAMQQRKYEVAEYNFKLACLIRPEDESAKKEAAAATRWVDALIAASIPVERKEVIYES